MVADTLPSRRPVRMQEAPNPATLDKALALSKIPTEDVSGP